MCLDLIGGARRDLMLPERSVVVASVYRSSHNQLPRRRLTISWQANKKTQDLEGSIRQDCSDQSYCKGETMLKTISLLIVMSLVASCSSLYNDRGISSTNEEKSDNNYFEREGAANRY